MPTPQIVIDSNVLVTALRSQLGASHKLLLLADSNKYELNLSVPLLLEYEEACKRLAGREIDLTSSQVDDILDYLCRIAHLRQIFYLWRPFLPDPDDDMVLELAFSAGCDRVITYNRRDFAGAERLGIRLLTPKEFLGEIGELP
jgi:putative PIN family toxin of toxin-antitoxin system